MEDGDVSDGERGCGWQWGCEGKWVRGSGGVGCKHNREQAQGTSGRGINLFRINDLV